MANNQNMKSNKTIYRILGGAVSLLVIIIGAWLNSRQPAAPPSNSKNQEMSTTDNGNKSVRSGKEQSSSSASSQTKTANSEPATVVRTIDGDTLMVNVGGQEKKLRILMIDTPESVHEDPQMNVPMGKTASDFTKSYLPKGKEITLEYDQEKTDQYGRLLAYIRVDGIDLGRKLVEEGLAKVVMYQPNKARHQEYLDLQKAAKKAKRGVWTYPYDEIFKK